MHSVLSTHHFCIQRAEWWLACLINIARGIHLVHLLHLINQDTFQPKCYQGQTYRHGGFWPLSFSLAKIICKCKYAMAWLWYRELLIILTVPFKQFPPSICNYLLLKEKLNVIIYKKKTNMKRNLRRVNCKWFSSVCEIHRFCCLATINNRLHICDLTYNRTTQRSV